MHITRLENQIKMIKIKNGDRIFVGDLTTECPTWVSLPH